MFPNAYNTLAAMSRTEVIICICAVALCAVTAVTAWTVLIVRAKRSRDKRRHTQAAAAIEEVTAPPQEIKEEKAGQPQPAKQPPAEAKPQERETPAAAAPPAPQPESKEPAPARTRKAPVKFERVKTDAPAPEGKAFIRIRYNRSFTAKLIQSPDAVKKYYSDVKNELEKYGLKERVSWRCESFRRGRKTLAKLNVRGKTLSVYLAADPAKYADTKYKVEDVSQIASNAATPARYRIKNDRRNAYVKQLIADLAAAENLTAAERPYSDFAAQFPYEELEPLIARKLVKVLALSEKASGSETAVIAVPAEVLEEVSVAQAEELIADEKAEQYVTESLSYSDKTKKEIVNIDTLARYFKKGEEVTLEKIKKRVPGINKRATYIKVLARGTLDKPLNVEADCFTAAAVKMIVLTGGKAIRKKTRA